MIFTANKKFLKCFTTLAAARTNEFDIVKCGDNCHNDCAMTSTTILSTRNEKSIVEIPDRICIELIRLWFLHRSRFSGEMLGVILELGDY